jgi:hypothetical protein
VGDYDSSRPANESVQLRKVEHVVSEYYLAYGLLSEPVTFPGFFPVTLDDQRSIPEHGSNITVVGYGGTLFPMNYNFTIDDLNRTEWPGPALETAMMAISPRLCGRIVREAGFPLRGDPPDSWFCGVPASPEGAQPCAGTGRIRLRVFDCRSFNGLALTSSRRCVSRRRRHGRTCARQHKQRLYRIHMVPWYVILPPAYCSLIESK